MFSTQNRFGSKMFGALRSNHQ